MKDPIDVPPIDDYEAQLENALVDEFLRLRGYAREDLPGLPADECAQVLREARMHAAEKLAEIGARAHYVKEIHGER